MLRTNCFELLCQCMSKYANNAELQTASLELLCVMATTDPAKKAGAAHPGDIVNRAIQNCMDQAPEPLFAMSVVAIDFMADMEECRRLLLVPQVLQVLLDAMENFHNIEIALHGASIFATLAIMEPSSHDLLMEVESYATIITMVTTYEDSKAIRTTCFSYLEAIFVDKNHCLTICNKGGLPFLIHGIEKKKKEKLVAYLEVLTTVFQHELSKKVIVNSGVLDKLFVILSKNAEEPAVVTAGLKLLKSVMTTRGIIPAVVEMNYLSAVIWCADNYKDDKEVCLEVLEVLDALATCPAVRAQMIASKCVETVFAMEPLFAEEHTFPVLACQMFANLDENAMIKERLGGAGIFDFLLAVLNHHIESAEATCAALRLLREQSAAVEKNHKKAATAEMRDVLCAIVLREDHANALTACDLLADVLMWRKALGADLSQNDIHQLVLNLVNCVEDTASINVCLHFLQAIGTRCSPSIESFLLLLFALMNAPSLDDACQVSILEVLRTIINNEMYVQVMAMAPYLARFFGIVEQWKKTPARLADLLQLNKSVLTSKSCISALINCNGIQLFTDLAKAFDVEALLTPCSACWRRDCPRRTRCRSS